MAEGIFQAETKRHLARYKREVLNIHEDGLWQNRRAYPHILPIAQRRLNILPVFCVQFWKWFAKQRAIRLHSDFHHLNSSQALCFNLFFPFMMDSGHTIPAIVKAIGLTGSPVVGACFEFEPNSAEGTNFDFMIPLETGNRIYFEVKYTESGFGSAKEDEEHLQKFQSVYHPRTVGRFQSPFCTASGFLKNYQILRTLWHPDLSAGDTAVFLFPRANVLLTSAEATIRSCLVEHLRSRVIVVYIEDFIATLAADPEVKDEFQDKAIAEFRMKYLPVKHVCG